MKKSIKDIKWKPTQRQFVVGFFAIVVLLATAKRITLTVDHPVPHEKAVASHVQWSMVN